MGLEFRISTSYELYDTHKLQACIYDKTNDNTIVTSFAHHMALSSVHLWSLTAEFHTSLFCFVPEAKHKHSRPF